MRSPHPIFTHPILQLLEKCKTLQTLNQVHAQMITTGLALHTYPLSRLLFFSSSLAFSYALSIFNQTVNPTVFLYNTLISSFCNKKQHIHIAFSLYNRILTHTTFKPNSHTFPSLFKACGLHPWLDHGRALHAHVLKFVEPSYDHFVQASLLNYYANYGKLDVARYLFDEITQPDLAAWNSILASYARIASCVSSEDDIVNLSLEVFHLFHEMQNSEVRPNEVTLVALIGACANLAAVRQGAWAHVYVLKNYLRLNRYVGTALIEMYSKCGYLELAYQLFDKLPQKDTLCYNAMIGGLAIHGHGNRALSLYEKMKLEGIPPDDVTFIVTMFACSHVGLVEEGCKIFESIEEVYKFELKVEHYGCLIDLLGRAGRVKEAEKKVRKMPMKPNAVLWRSLLGAARIHGHLEVGKIALKHLSELEPETSGSYVLLSNMYASIDRWDDVKRLRKLMKDQQVNKMPGKSLLDIGGATHEFHAGDKTHPSSLEIYLKLEEMNKQLQNYGYKPRTNEVLFDIEEEEKEDALSYHSERLAIAYALLVCDSSAPIRIIKNLRVCGDCHSSAKIISVIYGREIIVRDRNRFHHFKDGSCSCLDYW
ncbi:Pentatricopeptide repeat superfamily protein [Tripterygium wilfordii]|uniref:Pentatricopeptide repeat superfamily protein n=1 Tax=Tripterygium wilfordii TaxID=458696 RepID=A0A7J7D8Y9_TRIWF|nr:pentatricopeptide repeat-containing protein At5g43790 [Tripterygium wilfordii]KAF5742709.1 Pentatricopeptide repeat superfamily protein [Tripterygium wilfordii]